MYSKHIEFQEKVQAEVFVTVEPERSHLKNAFFEILMKIPGK